MTEQKIVFVTGKGGVGKSVVALALAKKYSTTKKVLLVELGLRSFYADFLNFPVQYAPSNYQKNLDIAIWSGGECLKEYALHLLKIESLYKLFFENRISRSLIDVAPGLSELSILGKITSGIRKIGPPLNYDVLVIDCYATGHMMAMLRAPRGMAEAVKFGPMAEQTSSMLATIRNPKLCEYVIVTLPEELPAVEADELYREIQEETGVKPSLVCNKVWPALKIHELKQLEAAKATKEEASFIQELEDLVLRQQAWVSYLEHRHNNLRLFPMTFSSNPSEITQSIEKALP
jgi:anion-transporting  ArsA/GET3 family ATPase